MKTIICNPKQINWKITELLEAAQSRGSFPQASSNRELRWYLENNVSNPVCLWLLKLVFLSETSFWSFDQIWHLPDKVKTFLGQKRRFLPFILFCLAAPSGLWNFSFPMRDSIQFSSVAQSCLTLCSTPGLPVHHQLQEFTQTHFHRVGDAIQPSHPLSSPSHAPNPS